MAELSRANARRSAAQFGRFIAIGILSTVIDAIVYLLLLPQAGISPAKAAGYVAGATSSIGLNYRLTFAHRGPAAEVIVRCAILYLTSLGVNVLVNWLVLWALPPSPLAVPAAFVCAVGVTTIYNFAGMKLIFERRPA